jgi:hypothetical protein
MSLLCMVVLGIPIYLKHIHNSLAIRNDWKCIFYILNNWVHSFQYIEKWCRGIILTFFGINISQFWLEMN